MLRLRHEQQARPAAALAPTRRRKSACGQSAAAAAPLQGGRSYPLLPPCAALQCARVGVNLSSLDCCSAWHMLCKQQLLPGVARRPLPACTTIVIGRCGIRCKGWHSGVINSPREVLRLLLLSGSPGGDTAGGNTAAGPSPAGMTPCAAAAACISKITMSDRQCRAWRVQRCFTLCALAFGQDMSELSDVSRYATRRRQTALLE